MSLTRIVRWCSPLTGIVIATSPSSPPFNRLPCSPRNERRPNPRIFDAARQPPDDRISIPLLALRLLFLAALCAQSSELRVRLPRRQGDSCVLRHPQTLGEKLPGSRGVAQC